MYPIFSSVKTGFLYEEGGIDGVDRVLVSYCSGADRG